MDNDERRKEDIQKKLGKQESKQERAWRRSKGGERRERKEGNKQASKESRRSLGRRDACRGWQPVDVRGAACGAHTPLQTERKTERK